MAQGLLDDFFAFWRDGDVGHSQRGTGAHGKFKAHALDAVSYAGSDFLSAQFVHFSDQVLDIALVQLVVHELHFFRQDAVEEHTSHSCIQDAGFLFWQAVAIIIVPGCCAYFDLGVYGYLT